MLRVISRIILTQIILVLLISCGTSAPERRESPDKILDDALTRGAVTPAKVNSIPVADRSDLPYIPIVTPPEVIRVWIYDHVTPSNDLVMGHWVYVKISDQDWYIKNNFRNQSQQPKLPLPPKIAEPQQMAPNVPSSAVNASASSDQQLKAILSATGLGPK